MGCQRSKSLLKKMGRKEVRKKASYIGEKRGIKGWRKGKEEKRDVRAMLEEK